MDSCDEGVSTLLTLILSAGILIGLGLGILFMGLSYLSSSTKSLEKRGWIFLIIQEHSKHLWVDQTKKIIY